MNQKTFDVEELKTKIAKRREEMLARMTPEEREKHARFAKIVRTKAAERQSNAAKEGQ